MHFGYSNIMANYQLNYKNLVVDNKEERDLGVIIQSVHNALS